MRQFTSIQAEKDFLKNKGAKMPTVARNQVLLATKIVRAYQDSTKSYQFFRQVIQAVSDKTKH